MQYEVWVEQLDGTGKITLMKGSDGTQASQLAGALVGAASGVSFAVGVSITQGGPPQPASPAPTPSARGGR